MPYFPTAEEATELNREALAAYGQTNHALLSPDKLEGALARAQQHWAYGEEEDPSQRLLTAAAKLGHGVGQAQSFEDGNKRTAYWLTRHFLNQNDLGHISHPDFDDEELADHLVGYGEGTHDWSNTAQMFQARNAQGNGTPPTQDVTNRPPPEKLSNILDPIHDSLDPSVWDHPDSPEPILRHEHQVWISRHIFEVLDKAGYDNPEEWLTLILTGSLTTYQYSEASDCDISLFVNAQILPEWSRAEMIGLMISNLDGTTLPGTTHELQGYVVSKKLGPQDLYKQGLRSGYVVYGQGAGTWLVPPERGRVHDVEREENEAYTIALENADKMDRLLRYEPQKAIMFWHQVHKRRMRDMQAGKGDFAPSNIVYKFLANRGLFPRIAEVSGEHIM